MNNVKMVKGTAGNRTISTITKQAEMKQEQLKKKVHVWELEWLDIDDGPLTISDVLMSLGVYILFPSMLIATILFVINV